MKKSDKLKFTPKCEFKTPLMDASSVPMPNLFDGILSQIEDMNKKKQTIVVEKADELGLEIDWELEKTRRFKSILVESHDDREIYFYNDGSKEGIRIVTFVRNEPDYSDVNLTMGYSYF